MNFIKLWNRAMFYGVFIGSILLIIYFWIHAEDGEGTYATEFTFESSPVYKPKQIPLDSRGERECRRVLESIFHSSFPNQRPTFLHNKITGQSLEIDCFNESLMLGCEYNGKQHYEYVPRFHKSRESFHNQQYRDDIKTKACEKHGVRLIVVPYTVQIPQIENYIKEKLNTLGFQT